MIRKLFSRIKQFITKEVWTLSLEDYPAPIAALLKYLRVILLAFRRFTEDRVQLRASALTYYMLMALVPVLAMIFGIAHGFGFEKELVQWLTDRFNSEEEVVIEWIIKFAQTRLSNVKGGLIAGVSLVMLFYSVMNVLSNIESSFNDIWQVKKSRSYIRKFTDYFSLMLIAPVFIFVAGSGNVFLATQLDSITVNINIVNFSPFSMFLMKLFPFVMIWLLFTFLYIIMPNTKVKFLSALLAGIIAGTAFQVVQWLYIDLQLLMSTYNAIYGTFAALPLLLIWMQMSWIIVLLGAEISVAYQNINLYEYEKESVKLSNHILKAYNLLVLERIVRFFIDGKKPQTAQELAVEVKLPIRLVGMVLTELLAGDLISEVYTKNDKLRAYAPAKDVSRYTIKYVFEMLEKSGNNRILSKSSDGLKKIMNIQENFLTMMEHAPNNILIQNLPDYQPEPQQ